MTFLGKGDEAVAVLEEEGHYEMAAELLFSQNRIIQAVEFLAQQSTPLFISLTKPEAAPGAIGEGRTFFRRDGLWITTRMEPRTFAIPSGASSRIDLSWDPVAHEPEENGKIRID